MMPIEIATDKPCNDDALNNPQISVVLLSGLPASGKSTLARKLKKRFNADDDTTTNDPRTVERPKDDKVMPRLVHIEYDDLEDCFLSAADTERNGDSNLNEIGDRRRGAWNQAREHAVEQMEQEIKTIIAGRESLSPPVAETNSPQIDTKDTVILMDDNFHLRGMRKQIHRLLLSYRPIRFGILYVDTPLDICLERNRKRSGRRHIPCEVIVKMSTSFEPPRVAWEASSTRTIVNPDFSEKDCMDPTEFEEIVKFIEDCPNIVDLPPESTAKLDLEQQAADRVKTRESQTHSLDKLLRSYVSRVAKFDKSFAKKANLGRKAVMEEFKAGRIEIDSVGNAFLEMVVPIDSAATTETDSASNSLIRSKLREVLEL